MKALTLTQPWASLIILGLKRIETRSWPTNWRGALAIHAGKSFPTDARMLCFEEPFRSALASRGITHPSILPTGEILGIVNILDCIRVGKKTEKHLGDIIIPPPLGSNEREFGDYAPGRFAWVFQVLAAYPDPIEARGALNLWNWTPPETNMFKGPLI